jgi:hypothetical protein
MLATSLLGPVFEAFMDIPHKPFVGHGVMHKIAELGQLLNW